MNFESEKPASKESGVEEIIQKMRQESSFVRREEKDGSWTIERNGENFQIELITSPEQLEVEKVQRILEETLSKEETEPIEVLRAAIKGQIPIGEKDPVLYKIHIMKNEAGEVISFIMGGLLNLKDKEGRDLNQTIFMGTYAVTKMGLRQKGFARELYVSALADAEKESKAKGKTLRDFAAEATSRSEDYWNKVNLKRTFIKLEGGGLEEMKYVQPPTNRNPKTGKPAKGAGAVPEHFSVTMMDGRKEKEIEGHEVLEMVDAFNRWTYRWDRSHFDNEAAFVSANKQAAADKVENQAGKEDL